MKTIGTFTNFILELLSLMFNNTNERKVLLYRLALSNFLLWQILFPFRPLYGTLVHRLGQNLTIFKAGTGVWENLLE